MDEDIRNFLAYVSGSAAEGEFVREIADEVEKVKEHREMRVEYMTLMMEMKEQRREGHQEGLNEGLSKGKGLIMKALQMIKDRIPDDVICKDTGCSIDELLQIKALVG